MKPLREVSLKRPKDFEIIGQSMNRLDTPEKTAGKAIFGIDVKVSGMLTALIARPPVFGAKVKRFNAGKAGGVPGVKEGVVIDSGVAVVGDSFWSAKLGREAMEITWDEGVNANLSTENMREEYANLAKTTGVCWNLPPKRWAGAKRRQKAVAGVLLFMHPLAASLPKGQRSR
jgi:isoquinoline 1-oxidoreductase subunit beta